MKCMRAALLPLRIAWIPAGSFEFEFPEVLLRTGEANDPIEPVEGAFTALHIL